MAPGQVRWRTAVEEARKEAREHGKLVLVDLFNPGWGGCKRMGAVTYPSPEVQRYIEDNFIPVQYNVAEHTDAADQFNSAWTPTIIVQDAEGREYRRSLGYLDPRRFLGEVALARLHRSIHRQDLRDATERVRDALEHTRGDTAREPEVLYFGAVVAYKSTGKAEHLKEGWDRLFKEFPESDWAKKTEFIRQWGGKDAGVHGMERHDLVVLGGGAAGINAAKAALALGASVALIDRGPLGGSCINRGWIPKKALVRAGRVHRLVREAADFGTRAPAAALDWAAVVARQHDIVERLRPGPAALERAGVRVVLDEARLVEPGVVRVDGREVHGRRVVIAAGSAPVIPPLEGREIGLTSDDLLFLPEFPQSLVLVGAGAIGLEMAAAFNDFGAAVTVIGQDPEILPGFDDDVAGYLRTMLAARGVTFHLSARVTALAGRRGDVTTRFLDGGTPREVRSSAVGLAVGRRFHPDALAINGLALATSGLGLATDAYLRTSLAGVYAAGDAAGNRQLTTTAAYEGRLAAANALQGDNLESDLSVVPQVIFTTPEIARVGLTHREAQAQGKGCRVSTHDMCGASNGVASGEDGGYLKLVFEEGTERLVGAQIVSYRAAELIQLTTLAIRERTTAGTLAAQLSIHPSHGERLIKVAGHDYHDVCEV